jgi:O-antigen/teichoic acid export membrane protein
MRIIRNGQEGSSSSQERLFATSHLLGNLRNRTISAGLITVTAQSAQFAFLLGSTAVLARLLNPHDYGLIAMVATVLGFLRIFNDAGLTTVTIQREDITNAQVSNLFWLNVLVAGSTTMLIAAAAPLIAWFYREPDLIGIRSLCPGRSR